jgi:hypothetical protein
MLKLINKMLMVLTKNNRALVQYIEYILTGQDNIEL